MIKKKINLFLNVDPLYAKKVNPWLFTYIHIFFTLPLTKVTKILIAPNKNFQCHLWSTSPPPKIDSSLNDLAHFAQRKSIHSQTSYLLYIASYKSNKNSKIHLPKIFQILKEFKSSNRPKTKISNPIYDPSPPPLKKSIRPWTIRPTSLKESIHRSASTRLRAHSQARILRNLPFPSPSLHRVFSMPAGARLAH